MGSSATVGRQPELDRLDALLAALEEGSAASVAIEGEPGIGKTRLLAELTARAAGPGLPDPVGDRRRVRAGRPLRGVGERPGLPPGRVPRRRLGPRAAGRARRHVPGAGRQRRQRGGRRALPRPPGGAGAAGAAGRGHAGGAGAGRPALGRPGIDRAGGRADAAGPRGPGPAGVGLPAGPGARAAVGRAGRPDRHPCRARAADRGGGRGDAGRPGRSVARGHLPPRRREPVLPRAAGAGQRRRPPARGPAPRR